MTSQESIAIVLVHLGESLPSHLLTMVAGTISVAPTSTITLVADQQHRSFIEKAWADDNAGDHLKFVPVQSIPPSHTTLEFRKRTTLDRSFREGFWFHATERFYVLADYLESRNIHNCLHLENDVQLYFDPADMATAFQNFASFAVPLDRTRSIPGIVWIRNPHVARSLTEHMLTSCEVDDMMSVAKFCSERPDLSSPLPTMPASYAAKKGLDKLRYCNGSTLFNGIFDAAAIGQFLGGIHWLNEPLDTRFFLNESSDLDLRDFDFSWDTHNGYRTPKIKFEGSSTPILAIHVHSKNMKAFAPTNTGAPTTATDIVTSDRLQALCDLTISTAALAPSDRLKHGVTRRVVEIPEKIEGGLFKLQRRRERIPPSEDFINICRSSRSIFVPAELLDYFQTYISPRLHNEFVIVTDNFDHPVGFDRLPLLNHPNLVAFFAQNTKLHHSKIVSLPIGVNNVEPDNKNITALFNQSKKIIKTDNLYVNTTASTSDSSGSMLAAVQKLVHFRNFSNQKHEQYLKILATHKFCICPGAGSNNRYLFWEAQYLDCIPIIMKDDWISAYSGLPLLIVNSWEDLSLLNLNQEYIRITTTAFDRSALSMEHHRAALARLINKST
jgi:hypothetical protein